MAKVRSTQANRAIAALTHGTCSRNPGENSLNHGEPSLNHGEARLNHGRAGLKQARVIHHAAASRKGADDPRHQSEASTLGEAWYVLA